MSYFIGLDLSSDDKNFSAAIIAKVENGILKIIDSKISNDSDSIKRFVKDYEPEHFTFNYHFKKHKEARTAELKKLAKEGKLLFPIRNN